MLRGTHSNEKTCEKTVDEKLLFVVDNGRVNESHDTNINFYLKKKSLYFREFILLKYLILKILHGNSWTYRTDLIQASVLA